MITLEEKQILACIPNLLKDSYFTVTSENTRNYNCIAWALGRTDCWYWPPLDNDEPEDDEYWPKGAPNGTSIEAFIIAMNLEGFEKCHDAKPEEGYTKIALYQKNGECTHAARLCKNGMWTSKMGPLHDIQHSSAESVEGDFYGNIHCYMKRKSD